jgi:vacuole morphology and inheritance protein 14
VQINEFVKLGGEQLVPYYADILGAILPCISDEEEKIRVVLLFVPLLIHTALANANSVLIHFIYSVIDFCACKVARETNEELRAIRADPTEGFDIGAILSIAKRLSFKPLDSNLTIIQAPICIVI